MCRRVDAEDAAAMAGGGIERAVGPGGNAPDDGLFGGEEGIEFRGEGEAAVAAERDAVELAFDEIGEAGHLPDGGVEARQSAQRCKNATQRQGAGFTL